jgi:hypothetical protein
MLTLQRAAGNRATARLVQREPTNAARLAGIAKQLHADERAGLAIDERDIHLALRVREGEDDGVRPGLNIVANLGARGQTGFVDGSGVYRGSFLSATHGGALPGVAIMLGSLAFQEGDDSVLATLRHELEHAAHDQMALDWVAHWRDASRTGFSAWMRRQKVSPVDLDLVRGATTGNPTDTELLAHLAGFEQVFENTPPPSATAILGSALPPAIEQLRGAAQRGFTGVDKAVKAAAEQRLADYSRRLDPPGRALLRDWLSFLHHHAATDSPKNASGDDARAARVVWQVFHPHVRFLEWMLGSVGRI